MTLQEAWKLLGLTGAPATDAELVDAFKRTVAAAQAKMNLSAATVDKDKIIRELQDAQQAITMLRQHLGGAHGRRRPAPSPRTTPQSATRRAGSGRSRVRPAPAPQGGPPPRPVPVPRPAQHPAPAPQAARQRHPAQPIPPSRTNATTGWDWFFYALALIVTVIFLLAADRSGDDEGTVQYRYIALQTTDTERVADDARSGGSVDFVSAPQEPSVSTEVTPLTLVDASGPAVDPPNEPCMVKLLSFPVAQIAIDHRIVTEAPGPVWHSLAPGLHVFSCDSAIPGLGLVFEGSFTAGRYYEVRADLVDRSYRIREVNSP